MIKLMIVDDEIGILANLRKCINWDTWGIALAADARNAVEGYEKALTIRPDILICDINMPGKDGLCLCADLKAAIPGLKIIILSGYDDPQYLHRALSLGVNEYLLKPAGIDTIVPAVLKMKEQILAERMKDRQSQLRDRLLLDNFTVLRLQFINNLLQREDASVDLDKAEMLGIPLCGPLYLTVILRILSSKNVDIKPDAQLSMEFYQLEQGLEQIQKKLPQSFCCEIKENDYFFLLNVSSPDQADSAIQTLNQLAHQFLAPTVAFLIGVGTSVEQIQEISTSYANASIALSRSTWDPEQQIFFYTPTASTQSIHRELNHLDHEIIAAIVSKQWSVCSERLSEAFALCQRTNSPLEPLREICRHIMLMTQPAVDAQKTCVRDYHVDEIYYANELHSWILSYIQQYSKNREPHCCLPIIQKAVQYIHTNYREKITLQMLSKELFVTPNYLGRLFRQETGCKMSDYLNRFRIERAKELLNNSTLKTSEIAESVGFSSYKYFLVCFAKYSDCSLRELRSSDGHVKLHTS